MRLLNTYEQIANLDRRLLQLETRSVTRAHADGRYLKLTGGTLTGNVAIPGTQITFGTAHTLQIGQRGGHPDHIQMRLGASMGTILSFLHTADSPILSMSKSEVTTQVTHQAISGRNAHHSLPYLDGHKQYFTSLKCWKTPGGTVHLQGMIHKGTGPHITTLPAEYRPSSTVIFTVHDAATGAANRLDIHRSGEVTFAGRYPTDWFSLNGIAWFVGW